METLEPLWIRHWSCIIVASQDHQGLTRDISGLMEGMWGGSWRGGGGCPGCPYTFVAM